MGARCNRITTRRRQCYTRIYGDWVNILLLISVLCVLTFCHSLTIANQMLSLVGSIQLDPFSPDHVAPAQNVDAHADEHQDSDKLELTDDADEQEQKRIGNSESKRNKHAEGDLDSGKKSKREKREADAEGKKSKKREKEHK